MTPKQTGTTSAFAVGLAGGISAGVDVILIKKDVLATIGDGAKVSGLANGADEFDELTGEDAASTRKGMGVLVSADATQSLYNLTVAGAGAGGVALAGAISVQTIQTQTFATIGRNAIINGAAGAGAAQDVAVAARDRTGIVSKDGGFSAAPAAGLAGAVDVGVIQSSVGAIIAAQSVSARRDVVVASVADKQISSNVLSGAGGLVGLAASVSVYSIGDGIGIGGKADSQLRTKDGNSLVGSAGQTVSQGNVLGALISRTTSNGDAANIGNTANARLGSVSVNADPTPLISPGTTATISGAVTAGGAISVSPGSVVDVPAIERDVAWFNKSRNAQIQASLQPGANFGLTDIQLTVLEPPVNAIQVFADNMGVESVGQYEAGINYQRYGLWGNDDKLTLYGVGAQGNLNLNVSYNIPFNPWGGRVGLSATKGRIKIVSGPYALLKVDGDSMSVAANAS